MEDLLTRLESLSEIPWLFGYDSREFYQLVLSYYERFKARSLQILLAESDPWQFLAIFLASVASKSSIFLGNPDWKTREWEQVFSLINPDLVFGDTVPSISRFPVKKPEIPPSIMIPTGGTSGKIRFAMHDWQTLSASVTGFCDYFQIDRVNAFCVLPLYHVSGLMQFLRCFLTGGYFFTISYAQLKQQRNDRINFNTYFISLVPTQLKFFIDTDPLWLSQFYTVLLGGAPAWTSLLDSARQRKIPVSLTYGMTETASQIVTLKPEDFRGGNNSNGRVLPHAEVRIDAQDKTITIQAKSLFLGYYPDRTRSKIFQTDDLGYFDDNNCLYIIGRHSQKIITGGKNVFPLEIETVIRETELVKEVVVMGIPDPRWGEAIVAVYVPIDEGEEFSNIQDKIKAKISHYKCPKHWIKVKQLPQNKQGKIDRDLLKEIILNNVLLDIP